MAPSIKGFYESHDPGDRIIADPFMGGGTPVIEANRLGMGVIGCDINAMAYWIVRQSLAPLDLFEFGTEAGRVSRRVDKNIGDLYETTCLKCGGTAQVKYFLWTKEADCKNCGTVSALFPRYMVAANERHTHYVWYCPSCMSLAEIPDPPNESDEVPCPVCYEPLPAEGNARGNDFVCRRCGEVNWFKDAESPPSQRLFAIEYYCSRCKPNHQGRFFKAPDADDFARAEEANELLESRGPHLIPEDSIPLGDETLRLHRWGYRKYRDLFNSLVDDGIQFRELRSDIGGKIWRNQAYANTS